MSDLITIVLLAGITLLISCGVVFCCLRRYEIGVFIIVLSPLVSTILIPNAPVVGAEKVASFGSYIRISLLVLMGTVGFIRFAQVRVSHDNKVPFHLMLLGIFLLLALVSAGYSIDQKYTVIRSLSFLALFGYLLGLDSWLDSNDRIRSVLDKMVLAILFCLAVNVLSIVAFPGKVWAWNFEMRFQGLWGHPNTFGSFCMISYPILLWRYWRSQSGSKWPMAFAIIILGILHILSGSRTSMMAAVIGILTWFFVFKKNVKLMVVVGLVTVSILLAMHFKPTSFVRRDSSSIKDLTGRPEIWHAGITLAMERPILGYGYGVAGKVFEDPRFYTAWLSLFSGSARASLHNGYLSVVIGLGVVGFGIFCLLLYMPLWGSLRARVDEYKAFVISMMFMCIVANFFESFIVGGSNVVSAVFWVTWAVAGKMVKLNVPSSDENMQQIDRQLYLTTNREPWKKIVKYPTS